ncbi:hypothetical protein BT63DRAFT_457794 [Microthyrium microscopicum]|uniref:alpha-galactosidase n=1 Tax=Microthyrium microscopicum TaxID=703497 RepID=A0A6A6U5W8_9PEZI|nr:hypothetical protein BT63DRAFT_457794 [Microthyrium microscopicum]
MDEQKMKSGSWWGRRSRRGKLLVIAIAVGIFIVALGLGLGLGLGLNNGSGGDNSESSTTPASPLPTAPTNGSVYQPPVNSTWQIVLLKSINVPDGASSVVPDVGIFDIDLFLTPKSTIDTLHNLGKKVICYFSAGSYEPDRPDSNQFKASDQGKGLKGWPGEKWLNLNSDNVRSIMTSRINLAAQKGCDAIDPDNMDAYDNDNGIGMTQTDSINFIGWMSNQTQSLRMGLGLKNAAAIIPSVLPAVQFSVQEQCVQFSECDKYSPFIKSGKPVFHIEYPSEVKSNFASNFCKNDGPANGSYEFSTVIKNFNLDGWIEQCNGATSTTPT